MLLLRPSVSCFVDDDEEEVLETICPTLARLIVCYLSSYDMYLLLSTFVVR